MGFIGGKAFNRSLARDVLMHPSHDATVSFSEKNRGQWVFSSEANRNTSTWP